MGNMEEIPKPTTIDFETQPIKSRPEYPPLPVGVSIKPYGKKSRYYAFGHLEGNNCCWSEAVEAVREAYNNPEGVLFQNGKFDVDIAEEHFGLTPPSWDKIHETMFLLYLDDPHQKNLGLKESAERILGLPPEEQDLARDYLLTNQPIPHIKITAGKGGDNYYGKYLCLVPPDILGPYAVGDTDRTYALFKHLFKSVCLDRDMLRPYQLEQELMLCLLDMERQGVPVDLPRLRDDVRMYQATTKIVDEWLRKKLKVAEVNFNSGAQLFNALLAAGYIDESKAILTPTGKYSTSKEALLVAVTDLQVLHVLNYRAQLNTCLGTFLTKWLSVAEKSNGLIYTQWNQTKLPKGKDTAGTRTGRLSSTPNFQNAPNKFKPLFKEDTTDIRLRADLPKCPFKIPLPQLPNVRSYIIPFPGDVIIDRDWSQQEIRILAHYAGGALQDMYERRPWADMHDTTKYCLEGVGLYFERKPVKNINFGLIYGMGIAALAAANDLDVPTTKKLKQAILTLYPGIADLYQDMKYRAAMNIPIRTWGGREYYCEPPKMVDGRTRTYDYKMVNLLIQGSGGDAVKKSIVEFYRAKLPCWKLILNVHDELAASVPPADIGAAMAAMAGAMSLDFDVPMLSEGDVCVDNWADKTPYDVKGKKVWKGL